MNKDNLTKTDVKLIEMLDESTLKLFNVDKGERMDFLLNKFYNQDNQSLDAANFSPLLNRKNNVINRNKANFSLPEIEIITTPKNLIQKLN